MCTYSLLTSLRYDLLPTSCKWNDDLDSASPFLLLPFHYDRLIEGTAKHGWFEARRLLTYDKLKSTCLDTVLADGAGTFPQNALKLRVTLNITGELSITSAPISSASFTSDPTTLTTTFLNHTPSSNHAALPTTPLFDVYLDTQPTPASIFTTTKTTHRDVYNTARSRTGLNSPGSPPSADDVLLYNPKNFIMETSIFNVAFYRASRWVTPHLSTGCLPGVMRRFLIQQAHIYEAEDDSLTLDQIKEGDLVLLFNGVQGCRMGRIVAR